MTSKNYLCKSIKENIRRNMFLTILISLALLVVFPVYCITGMEGAGQIEAYMGMDGYQRMLLRCIGPDSPVKGEAAARADAPFPFSVLSGSENQFDEIIHQLRMDVYRFRLLHQRQQCLPVTDGGEAVIGILPPFRWCEALPASPLASRFPSDGGQGFPRWDSPDSARR